MKYISIFFASILILTSCGNENTTISDIKVSDDITVKLSEDSASPEERESSLENIGEYNIVDVTEGKEVRGVLTSETKGYGKAAFLDDTYSLAVVFENLPEPQNGDFYEGWVVQKEPFKFISTGKIETQSGMQVNTFTSATDYRSYDFYVLTLEPNDGDPAPADHILEGTLIF